MLSFDPVIFEVIGGIDLWKLSKQLWTHFQDLFRFLIVVSNEMGMVGTGEVDWNLRALSALVENPGSVSITYILAHNSSPRQSDIDFLLLQAPDTDTVHTHT